MKISATGRSLSIERNSSETFSPFVAFYPTRASGLRVVSKTEERSHPTNVDIEMKAILDDMKRRYSVTRARLEDVDNTPDAA